MLIRRAVGSGVVVVRGRLHGRGSIALRCASGAQRTSQSNVRFNDSVTEVYAGLSNKMEDADAQQAKRRGEPNFQ